MDINNIKKQLIEASDSYYNKGISILSDANFDGLKDILAEQNPNDPFLKTIGAPVPETSEWTKAKHNIPMGSLSKVNTLDGDDTDVGFKKWWKKTGLVDSICSEKLDGISIDLIYEQGNFVKAITRGDGIYGEDITANVSRMQNVPKTVKDNWDGSVRGEIIITEQDFESINNILIQRGQDPLKNKRNGTTGIAKRLDGVFSEYLTILVYDVTGSFKLEEDKLKFLEHNKFKTVWWKHCESWESVDTIYRLYDETKRAILSHEIDGLVIKTNLIELQNKLGEVDGKPKHSIAWKFPSIKGKATIIDCEWQLGSFGKYTPVAIFEPIAMGGVTIRRATLHNYERFVALDLHNNDVLLIERCNDVIPGVIKNLESGTSKGEKFEIPTHCRECKTELEIKGDNVLQLICPNENCKGRELSNLSKWANVIFKDSKGLGEKTIKKFHELGLITTPDDFYKLKAEQISTLDGFGDRKAEIILKVINENKEVTLDNFIGGLNIQNFGRRMAKHLIEAGIDNLQLMQNVSIETLIGIEGIEQKTAHSFKTQLDSLNDKINNLLDVGVVIVEEDDAMVVEASSSNVLDGKSFCFTGAIQREENGVRLKRKDMQAIVKDNGGCVCDKVKAGLDYLVQADPNKVSSKTKAANKWGTNIISEEAFFKLLGK